MLYSLLIMALAVLPALFIAGENEALFGPLVQSYLLALVVSMIVALTVTAALAYYLPVGSAGAERRSLRRLQGSYSRAVTRLAGKTRWVFATAAVVAVAGLALVPFLAANHPVVPVLADKTLVVHWSAIAGTSDQEMSRITEAAAQELRAVPGVANVGGHVGRAITSDQVNDVSSGELWVTVAPDAAYADTATAVERVIAGYPGLTSKVSTYPQERIDQIREEADSGFAVASSDSTRRSCGRRRRRCSRFLSTRPALPIRTSTCRPNSRWPRSRSISPRPKRPGSFPVSGPGGCRLAPRH